MKKYQVSLAKAVLGTFGWLTGILVLANGGNEILRLLLLSITCSIIIGFIFSVGYPIIWKEFTTNQAVKIGLSSIMNIGGGCLVIGLLFPAMFTMIFAWIPAMLLLSIVLHTICSFFYQEAN
ncbi:hypothetical protein [Enterococcus phoeniculicola]|uniref:Major facilitator superfamily (MFS) profile domain-containing protein n=1 Tax=Enterococcus phoeniculicola ATCC BAA-412 TaxID=1158610 RepID=R3TR68_9ENTE|nr:hypothetical protein [Enterococcus phoeniculicola]EOL44029.1 hypothetical protein UC3_01659 [Enterococcus phoeniculicola ATCC BAA-412]EOT75131.1 hypothetical protein I589_02731 [Enterococcus phoeniculicola ATCC BAA-412]